MEERRGIERMEGGKKDIGGWKCNTKRGNNKSKIGLQSQ